MKIIHITDTHLVGPGGTIYGLDPAARLEAVVDDIAARHADAELAVITGDLADCGEPHAYRTLAALLARLPMPVRLIIGNHDSRANFIAAFPDHPVDASGFVQSVLDAPGGLGRLLFLDTNEPGWSGGRYCADRLVWLDARLREAEDRPVLVFMHHPPFQLGVRHFERICLAEPQPFLTRLRQHRGGVRHLFLGHVHIPVSGVLAGIPFTAGRGCNHQIVLDFDAKECRWAAGAPNYSIIMLDEAGLFVHAFDLVGAPQIGVGQFPPGP